MGEMYMLNTQVKALSCTPFMYVRAAVTFCDVYPNKARKIKAKLKQISYLSQVIDDTHFWKRGLIMSSKQL